jgi:DNA-binding NtrC family response regulator
MPDRAKATVLVADDDASSLKNLEAVLSESGYQVLSAPGGAQAIELLKSESIDVVVTDIRMEGPSGIDVLNHVVRNSPDTAVILVTGYGTIESAVEAMRQGATDYLTKPVDINKLEFIIDKALHTQQIVAENLLLKQQLHEKYSFGNIVGRSASMRSIFQEIEQVATTNATVLIQGESGTGKELIASALHHHSSRANGPLVKVNCVAFVETLIESELFGHEKGAFTGAHRTRKGRIEMAHQGTLFLDEIGDLSLSAQLKLLRVLQEREIERVGGNVPIPVDVRLVAATNRDLESEVEKGTFREELYYRIKVISIKVPPLTGRAEDIPLLVNHFVETFNAEHDKKVEGLSPAAMRAMVRYGWPGNVRELRNVVESLVVVTRSAIIEERDLPADLLGDNRDQPEITISLGVTVSETERQVILATLRMTGGNKARAARILGIGKKTLYRKLADYGVLPDDPSQPAESQEIANGQPSD